MIKTRRTYNKPETDDGFRILVDRIWPRGVKKNDVKIDSLLLTNVSAKLKAA